MDSNEFHPVLKFVGKPQILDFTQEGGFRGAARASTPFTVGRYAERRKGVYTAPLFGGVRDWHMGIDLGAPAGMAIYAFDQGVVEDYACHDHEGDYGPTLITRHLFKGKDLYVLWGHLSLDSIQNKRRGDLFARGECIAHIGSQDVNGGWPPHVHIQLSWVRPINADLPGVVSEADFESAKEKYPDPRMILGPLY